MPSKQHRLALTVPPDLRDVLADLADAQGRPVSATVIELLKEMQPQLVGITKVIRAVKSGNVSAAKTALIHTLGDGMAELFAQHQAELFAAKKTRVSKVGRATR